MFLPDPDSSRKIAPTVRDSEIAPTVRDSEIAPTHEEKAGKVRIAKFQ